MTYEFGAKEIVKGSGYISRQCCGSTEIELGTVYAAEIDAMPNGGYSDHIGFVEEVSGGNVTAIEGNKGEMVARRKIPLGWGYIRGYAAPKYAKAVNGTGGTTGTGKKNVEAVAKEVLAGKWGNGENRKKKLQAAGYDYGAVQKKVNELMR